MLARKYLVFWVFVAAFFGLIFIMLNLKATQLVSLPVTPISTVCPSVSSQLYPTNSRFVVTKSSSAYEANPDPACWLQDCKMRNNHKAYRGCTDNFANDWNALGVISMERYLNAEIINLPDYNSKSLMDAIWYFKNATAVQKDCAVAWMNLGISQMQKQLYTDALESLNKASDLFGSGQDRAEVQMFMGLTLESQGRVEEATKRYEDSRASPDVEKSYWGVVMTDARRSELTKYGTYEGPEALRSFATFAHFSPVSIGNWALLLPGTQDWFLENRFIVMRKILPPFVLRAASKYYRDLISNKVLKLGDTQAKRYVAYNDRIARFIHQHITQMVRRITAHNVRPSYTYFGGYVTGAELKPHTDRAQCEFTISLNIEQMPHNKTWMLSLDKRPLFDKDVAKSNRANNVQTDQESEIANADLYAGDALLFMGRHLIHFRRGQLPPGEWTNQIFMHYVQEGFTGKLG